MRLKLFWMSSSLLGACRRCIYFFCRMIAWVPVLFVAVLLTWGYYVYVYVIHLSGSFPNFTSSLAASVFLSAVFLILAHVIFCLQLASYIRTIITQHGAIPAQYKLTQDQLEQLDQAVDEQVVLHDVVSSLPVCQLSRGGGVRFCEVCNLIKPDRCHHCSVCNRCVLKMDHHCPWVNNCVGYSNYKFFVLFLFYSVVLCGWLCATGLNAFILAWGRDNQLKSADKFQVIIWYFICSMFGFSTAILFCFHIYLTLYNKTTLENMQPPHVIGSRSHRPYFISFKENFQQVFGSKIIFALVPVSSSQGDGVVYPVMKNSNADQSQEHETQPLSSQTEL